MKTLLAHHVTSVLAYNVGAGFIIAEGIVKDVTVNNIDGEVRLECFGNPTILFVKIGDTIPVLARVSESVLDALMEGD